MLRFLHQPLLKEHDIFLRHPVSDSTPACVARLRPTQGSSLGSNLCSLLGLCSDCQRADKCNPHPFLIENITNWSQLMDANFTFFPVPCIKFSLVKVRVFEQSRSGPGSMVRGPQKTLYNSNGFTPNFL